MKTLSCVALSVLFLAGCAAQGPAVAPVPAEHLLVLTAEGELLRVAAVKPGKVLSRTALKGLVADERLVGIDYRVARGVLFGLSSRGQLYTVDVASGVLTAVGQPTGLPEGRRFGFDFNPAADRIRVVSDAGASQRRHPDTGALVANDSVLAYVTAEGTKPAPQVVAAAYTYNKRNEKLTTNYALDVSAATLVMQGSKEGTEPVVSPNSGQLTTVGALDAGAIDDASFDISDVHNTALAALASKGRTQLYRIDLDSGRATRIGKLADGSAVVGIAIQP